MDDQPVSRDVRSHARMDQTDVSIPWQESLDDVDLRRPNQLFMPHINMVDFAIWPAFRELVVQLPSMQEHMGWLIDLSNSVQCEWPYELDQALYKDETTGRVDLVDLAKV